MKRILKLSWLSFAIVVVIISLYLRISGIQFIGFRSMILMMFLGMFPFIKNNLFRLVAFLICIIGVYDFFFLSVKSAEPTIFEFMFPVNHFFFRGETGSFFHWILKIFPLIFYSTTILILLGKRIKDSAASTV